MLTGDPAARSAIPANAIPIRSYAPELRRLR
jgi:hypothetical protein